jgi:hypothetical protein
MPKKLIILAIMLLVSIPVFAQEVDTAWVRRYNGPADSNDCAFALAVDGSGNVFVTGASFGSGTNADYATIKYLPTGDTAWIRRYNGSGNLADSALTLAVDGSGNVYVTGASSGSGTNADYATIKYLLNGDTAWVRRYNAENGNDVARALAVDGSGNVYVTGESFRSSTYLDYITIKYLTNGDTAWVRRYNGPVNGADYAWALAVDDSGNVYVTGQSMGSGTDADYATIKYLPNGDTAWVRRYNRPGGNEGDYAYALAVDGSGNVFVTGSSVASGSSWADYTTIKYLPNGDTAWVRRYNGPGNSDDWARAIAVDGSGNVYVTGLSFGSGTGEDYCTIKYKPNGDTAWVRRYNGPGNAGDDAHAIAIDASGNVYVTGESFGSGANYDYATIKYSPDGYTVWEKRYNGPVNGHDHSYAIALDGSGNVYVTGKSFGSGTDYDYATIKYCQYICGNVNGDDIVDIVDWIYLFQYCFLNGPPPINPFSGDMDGYGSTTIRDIAYLRRYLFEGNPAPYCNPGSEYAPTGEPSDAIIVYPHLLPSNDSIVAVTINYQNNSSIVGFALPLKITIGGEIPVINSAIFSSRITNLSGLQAATIDSAQGTVNVGFCAGITNVLSPGSGIILTLNLSITPVAYDRQIQVDTVRIAPFNYPMFIKQNNLSGVIPGYMLQDRNDTLLFIAYSPVNLIVTNPDGDSIELGFNNIPNATYDTTTDRNHDGHTDDIVTIPNPAVGQYLVRVVTEPGGSGNYTCAVKLDGNEERVMIANASAPGPGEVDTVIYTVPEYLHGDANRDGRKTVSDVVFLINYLFKGGPAPDPVNLGDVNFCKQNPPVDPGQPTVADVVYLVNYLFKGGPAPCS